MKSADQTVRRVLRFRGRVQGVGFRQTTREIAQGFPVAGFVENLPDGRVLLVVEGAAADVDDFAAAVEAEMQRLIAGIESESESPTGEFCGFTIRR